MTKFAKQSTAAPRTGRGAIKSTTSTLVRNHGGALAYGRDSKSDLFLLGVMNFVSEDTYYEKASDRDNRFLQLVHAVTAEDPDWVARFVPWLRNEANMRSASVVAAVEYGRAGGPFARKVVDSACSRADEPAEVLAYWIANYGRPIPSWLKRGVADAAQRLYTERSVVKYDGNSKDFRFGDVINLTFGVAHVKPKDEKQAALFKYCQDTRFGATPSTDLLPGLDIARRINSGEITRDELLSNLYLLQRGNVTWESLSGLGKMDARAWEAIIPTMGYMALIRNLRNFEQAGISDESTEYVVKKLQSASEVAQSRQLPFRFWSAYKNVQGLQWGWALEKALGHSVKNIPSLGGRTLLLVDTSDSMNQAKPSEKSTMCAAEIAALFGAVLALRGEDVDWYGFANSPFKHDVPKGSSVLKAVEGFRRRSGETGHGTNIPGALRMFDKHDRVILISDMQTLAGFSSNRRASYWDQGRYAVDVRNQGIPEKVPVFGFNLNGYGSTQIGEKNTFELGGLTDHTFKMLQLLERGKAATWPF